MTTTSASTSAKDGYRIAEVARLTGFSAATLRYYEGIGVMPPARRTEAGYRVYDDRAVERLAFVARAKQLGCSLPEIAELARAWDADECRPVQHRLRALVEARIAVSRRQTAELVRFTEVLQATAASLAGEPVDGPCTADCGCGPAGDVPIACSLEPEEMPGRLQEWRDLLAAGVTRTPLEGGVRVEFGADAPLGQIARLVAAEHDCCRFFSFAVTADHRGVGLEVTAPDDGQELLATVFGAAG